MTKEKFKCRDCNKDYEDILGAIACPCENKANWKNPNNRKLLWERQ